MIVSQGKEIRDIIMICSKCNKNIDDGETTCTCGNDRFKIISNILIDDVPEIL